ncbi:MAG: haloacid dehalogenase type II [Sarcina sp.]
MKNVKVCVFDAYGTLFDVHSASRKMKSEIGENYEEFSNLWRAKQLEYSFLREIMGEYKNFLCVTEDALTYAMQTYKINVKLKDKLMDLYRRLDAYEEVLEVLNDLQSRGIKTVILSNGSYEMLNDAVSSSRIDKYLDKVLSVEKIEKFKPNKEVYQMVNDEFKVNSKEVVFFSSNGWDIAGATSYGFNTIWINRFKKEVDELDSKPNQIAENLRQAILKF